MSMEPARGRSHPPVVRRGVALLFMAWCSVGCGAPSARARAVAAYARATYSDEAVAMLGDLLSFRTVHRDEIENAENPEFQAMAAYLERKAAEFGLDFTDHGSVIVIGLGDGVDRLGLIAHGDVQPADASKWARDPFSLDTDSEPGRLVGRGSLDDKGPIVAALYAMRALKERDVPLARRIELIISMTEESDWEPFRDFLANHDPPGLNIGLDSEYPVVVAEKSWNSIHLTLPADRAEPEASGPRLISFLGGAFLAQIPEDAEAIIADPTPELEERLRAAALQDPEVAYSFATDGGRLTMNARGVSAHSSKPWDGRNAITHLASVLGFHEWPDTQAARMVRLINDLVGTGDYGKKFGEVPLSHPFMGRLTLSLTTMSLEEGDLVAGINIRSPAGRSPEELERLIREAVERWKEDAGADDLEVAILVTPPYLLEGATHVPVLLDVFSHFTGLPDPKPISIGGGTHARLLPGGVDFGPTMPGEPYTGHSEHEYWMREGFELSLEMYSATLVELAGA